MEATAEKVTHTPGPWHDNNGADVRSGPIGAMAYVSVAGARGRVYAEACANARLIAAAPDMLGTLQTLVAYLDECNANGAETISEEYALNQSGYHSILTYIDTQVRAVVARAG